MNPDAAPRRFAIGLGSNVGDRMGYLRQALALLEEIDDTTILATSRVYTSAGWGRADLEPFLNAAVAGETQLAPRDLLAAMRLIEDRLGRQRTISWGPRTLDLDLLLVDDLRLQDDQLTLPHPWIAARPFVVYPLADVVSVQPFWQPWTLLNADGRAIAEETVPAAEGAPVWPWRRTSGDTGADVYTDSEEATEALAARIAPWLAAGTTVALDGAMGAGKSVFARGLARGLGVQGPVQSPTFTLCRIHASRSGPLEHWDFYRMTSVDDLESSGFFSPVQEPVLRVVEWASHFEEALAEPRLRVSVTMEEDGRRRIHLSRRGRALPMAVEAIADSYGAATP